MGGFVDSEGVNGSVAEEWKMRCPRCNSDEQIDISPWIWVKLLWARLFPEHWPDWHRRLGYLEISKKPHSSRPARCSCHAYQIRNSARTLLVVTRATSSTFRLFTLAMAPATKRA